MAIFRWFPQKNWRTLIAGFILFLCLNAAPVPSPLTGAATDAVKWTKVNIPTEGSTGGWTLAAGSEVQHLTMARDGTLYAYGSGLTYTLFKSIDGGYSWSNIGHIQDSIVAIATSPTDDSTLYYATSATVYRSADGGKNFHALPASPGGAGSNNVKITSLDVTRVGSNIIVIGTRDTDALQFGGVYTLDEEDAVPVWKDANIGLYDVYAVAASPGYAADRQMVAVITDETDTMVAFKSGDAAWGAATGNARLDRDNSGIPTHVVVAASAAIAFPGDYEAGAGSSNAVCWVAIDTGAGAGDIYKISGVEAPGLSTATDLNTGADYGLNNIDVTGLAARGDTQKMSLLAGASGSARTYFSADSGKSWTRSRKDPTGGSSTCVLMAPDFDETGRVYAATGGAESAFSVSRDRGDTWNQTSLIDTQVSTIVDAAPSPGFSRDNTCFLLTFGGEHSLWRSLDGGGKWERTFSSAPADVDSIKLAALPPSYGDNKTLFLAGESNGQPALWRSGDNGQSFKRRLTRDSTPGGPIPIDAWALVDDATLFIASFDGSHGLVYGTTNGGATFSKGATAGDQSINSLILSPAFNQDETLLVGNTNGRVFISEDNGASFEPLPADAASPPLTGVITVAFDPAYESNQTIYAASSTADKGVYRFVIGSSTNWESLDNTLPAGAILNRLAAAGDGTLYAANSHAGDGMERCLNPTYSLGPTFESVTRGLSESTTLSGLWQTEHRIWSADTANIRLMSFNDTLTSEVIPTSPANKASSIGALNDHTVRNISLDWTTMEGATSYQWQLDVDTDLSSVPAGFEGTTRASSATLPALQPATTYYWRVRAKEPVSSKWSEKRSFTTILDTEGVALRLESPEAGAVRVPVKPVFQWTAVNGAVAYELLVSADANFSSPSIVKNNDYALSATAWKSDLSLDYDTTYYWKVRAVSADTRSAWSAAGAFTTELPPVEPPLPPAPGPGIPPSTRLSELSPAMVLDPSPAPRPMQVAPPAPVPPAAPATSQAPIIIQSPATPDWVFYLIGALMLTIILMLIIIMVLVTGMRN